MTGFQSIRLGVREMKKIAVFAVLAMILAGCAAPKYNYRAQSTQIKEPAVGELVTRQVGDPMLRQGNYREHESIYVATRAEVSWAYTLEPGYYLKHGEDERAEYFVPGGGNEAGSITKGFLADPWKSVMVRKDENDLCVVTVFNAYQCRSGADFEKKNKAVVFQDSFQQTLIYNGRIGNKVNVGYREFSGNYARPAFNNNVEYDLSDSNVIGYKGAQIEVIEATNQYVKYKVLRHFPSMSN
jgi:hypothetical protein